MILKVRPGATSEAIIFQALAREMLSTYSRRQRMKILARVSEALADTIVIPISAPERAKQLDQVRDTWAVIFPQLLD